MESGEDYVNVPESEESADASLGEWLVPHGALLRSSIPPSSSPTNPPPLSVWPTYNPLGVPCPLAGCPPFPLLSAWPAPVFGVAIPPSDLFSQMGAGSM